jgi:NADPH:quinone reductase-like Zn-dependent oxidoreductase
MDSPIISNSIVLKNFNSLTTEKLTISNLPAGYVLIKVVAGGVGPYDLYHIDGRRKLDLTNGRTVLGFEGSGIVSSVAENVDNSLVGKKVSFMIDFHDKNCLGSWGEYAITLAKNVLILDDKVNMNQAAYLFGNPLTAICLFNDMIKGKHKCIILDTASSALGRMIIRLCLSEGIKMINIVRRDVNIKILEEEGSTVNFSSNSTGFYKHIKEKITEMQPSLYITCLGGGMQSTLFEYMGERSILCSIGNMNESKLFGFSTAEFIFKRKEIRGWFLFPYLKTISGEKLREFLGIIEKALVSGDKTFLTSIKEEVNLIQFEEGLRRYKQDMSGGKIVIKP